ncbi:MAG: aminopeptidase P family protein [Candidatus Lokiarchaeota archaeon]|nr:aminopeptidase P family protein [Candidatus Lokiarchaeota archaeon]
MNKFDKAAGLLKQHGIDAWLISCDEGSDMHSPYFLGIKSHARHFIIIDANGNHQVIAVLMEAPMIQKAVDAMGAKVAVRAFNNNKEMVALLKGILARPTIAVNYGEDSLQKATGFADHIRAGELESLRLIAPGTRFVSSVDLVAGMRMVKTPAELAALREAVKMTMEVFESIPTWVKVGMTEQEVMARLHYEFFKIGEPSFEAIVASGENTADPHHNSSGKRIAPGAFYVDAGIRHEQMSSDITWTFWIGGEPPGDFLDAYNALYEAKRVANRHMRAGLPTALADQECRKYLEARGYDHKKLFVHGLGHAIGYDVHDVGPRASSAAPPGAVFEENMVYSNEPGLYWQGRWGLRLEDDIIIKRGECEQVSYNHEEPIVF